MFFFREDYVYVHPAGEVLNVRTFTGSPEWRMKALTLALTMCVCDGHETEHQGGGGHCRMCVLLAVDQLLPAARVGPGIRISRGGRVVPGDSGVGGAASTHLLLLGDCATCFATS